MKICLLFCGLQRTIKNNYQNIIDNLIDTTNEFDIHFVTWKDEPYSDFLSCFPNAKIHLIDNIHLTDLDFKLWSKDLNIHISWMDKWKTNENALFRVYQQFYILKQSALILENSDYDLIIKTRTDISLSRSIVNECYESFYNLDFKNIYFPNYMRHCAFIQGQACTDMFFFGKKEGMIKVLKFLDYINTYKTNYIDSFNMFFKVPTPQYNIIQPESTLYLFLEGEGFNIVFLDFIFNRN